MENRTETPHQHLVAERNDIGWPEHRDVTPAPQPIANGKVVSICSCGKQFVGIDPDHADWQLIEHIDANSN